MVELNNGKWFGLKICLACKEPLSNHEVKHNNGVCPECGKKSPTDKIETEKIALRYVESKKWFASKGWFEVNPKDDFAVAWLAKFGHKLKSTI